MIIRTISVNKSKTILNKSSILIFNMSEEVYFSPFQLSKVCAFVDAQGFGFKRSSVTIFLPRELTFCGEKGLFHQTYNTSIEIKKLPKLEQRTLLYQSQNIHGMTFVKSEDADVHCLKKFKEDLLSLHDKFKTREKEYLAVKNNFLAFHLRQLNIKFINLCQSFVPKAFHLDLKYNNRECCQLHACSKFFYQCSRRKAKHFYRWIVENTVCDGYKLIF